MTGLLEGRRALVTGGAACDASKTAPKFALMGARHSESFILTRRKGDQSNTLGFGKCACVL